MRIHRLVTGLLALAVVSACSAFPERTLQDEDVVEGATDGWQNVPAHQRLPSRKGIALLEPERLPTDVATTPMDMSLVGRVSMEEVAALIQNSGVSVILTSEELEGREIFLPTFNGTLEGLLDTIASATDLSYQWTGSAVVFREREQYVLTIPQNEELAERIGGHLEQVGATEVQSSVDVGMVSYEATYREQSLITRYLEQLSVNTALVNLQLAVITVELDNERGHQFNWSLSGDSSGQNLSGEGSGNNTLNATDGDVGVALKTGNFGLSATLNFLSTYGESHTAQNVTLRTLSGVPVRLRSGDTIPYVGEVRAAAGGQAGGVGGTRTQNIETGFTVEATPHYDDRERQVTVSLDMEMSSLVQMRELDAGEQVGTISQPQTQEQEFGSIVRLAAGESALLGGLIFESGSTTYQGISGLEHRALGQRHRESRRQALFILLRPSVTVYGGQD